MKWGPFAITKIRFRGIRLVEQNQQGVRRNRVWLKEKQDGNV